MERDWSRRTKPNWDGRTAREEYAERSLLDDRARPERGGQQSILMEFWRCCAQSADFHRGHGRMPLANAGCPEEEATLEERSGRA